MASCMMKAQATRHLALAQDGLIIWVISLFDTLRYYHGVESRRRVYKRDAQSIW